MYCKTFFYAFVSLLAACLVLGCSSKKNELEQAGLKGNVKSLREITYQAVGNNDTVVKGDVVMAEDIKNYYAEYNRSGNMQQLINYDNNNEQSSRWIFFYDADGKALGGNYYHADGTLLDSTYYVYDRRGNITEYYHYLADGKLKSKIFSDHDRRGNVVSERFITPDNITERTTKCKYSGNNLTEDQSYASDNRLVYFSRYEYDRENNLVKQTIYNADSTVNSSGIYTYNKHSDMISCTSHNGTGQELHYTYTYLYDHMQNWIQKITFLNGEAVFLTVRQFEYYK
ncbi:MAG: hypothetical protein J6M30_06640 [Bacteroidales bacterium]|nr:hypothetical protein [Bacteroidales bacterium]